MPERYGAASWPRSWQISPGREQVGGVTEGGGKWENFELFYYKDDDSNLFNSCSFGLSRASS